MSARKSLSGGEASRQTGSWRLDRVLFINATGEPGGTEIQTIAQIGLLRAHGFEVAALFDCQPGPICDFYDRHAIPYRVAGTRLWPSREVRCFIESFDPSAFYVFGLKSNLKWRLWLRLLWPATRRWGAMRGLTNTKAVGWHRIMLDRLTLPLLDGYVCNSRFVESYLARHGFPREKLFYSKNLTPIDPIERQARPLEIRAVAGDATGVILPSPVPAIVCVANVRAVKGHGLLLRALRLLKRDGARFVCLCVGDVARDAPVVRQAARLGLAGDVVWAGYRADVPAILARSDVLVLPSFMEGCPNAVLEAMRARLPVVASPWGDQAWLVEEGKGGFIVDPRDSWRLADRLTVLLGDPERRRAFGEHNLRKLAAEFDPVEVERSTLDLYAQMVAPRTLRPR